MAELPRNEATPPPLPPPQYAGHNQQGAFPQPYQPPSLYQGQSPLPNQHTGGYQSQTPVNELGVYEQKAPGAAAGQGYSPGQQISKLGDYDSRGNGAGFVGELPAHNR
jgi:hypothetical protein